MRKNNAWFVSIFISLIMAITVFGSGKAIRTNNPNIESQNIFPNTGTTERIPSVGIDGKEPNLYSDNSFISTTGRYITFKSKASNLVEGDYNGWSDVFVFDRETGITDRISVASDGSEAVDYSDDPVITSDGRYVAFTSYAFNLVPGDANGVPDIFLHDRLTQITERISVNSAGAEGNDNSYLPSISADGRYVAFKSYASNLVSGDTNGEIDCFVRDRQNGTTEIVSVASDGTTIGNNWCDYPNISSDGRYVTFASYSDNLVPGDTNGFQDIFLRDRLNGTTEMVSLAYDGIQANGFSNKSSISADGNYIVFDSFASNLVADDTNATWDIFIRDRAAVTTFRVSLSSEGLQGDGASQLPFLTSDGRFIAFESTATNLVADDTNAKTDIFVRDQLNGTTERVSVSYEGVQADKKSYSASISDDGRYSAFISDATNLVSSDLNKVADVFVRDRTFETISYSISGTLKDISDNPIAGVVITDGAGHITTTDTNGAYIFSNLAAGEYLLTPNKAGYTFDPQTRLVVLPPDAVDQNFTGTPGNAFWSVFIPILQRQP